MDKLQPVIKHRFWILAALVPPLCIFGYYKANGAPVRGKPMRA